MSEETLIIEPLTPRIGAEVSGVDLVQPSTNAHSEALKTALAYHSAVPGLDAHTEIVASHADANAKYVAIRSGFRVTVGGDRPF
jgi:alpha-ketoglutarate-dependent taurine dioxygenase